MFDFVTDAINSRTKNEWLDWLKGYWQGLESWAQENGLHALLLGLLAGFFFAVFFRFFCVISALAGLLGLFVYFLAPEDPKALHEEASSEEVELESEASGEEAAAEEEAEEDEDKT